MSLVMRSAMLGLIVFYSITAIPNKEVSTRNKLIISIVVVVLYALLDYFSSVLKTIRRFLCRMLCGCSPDDSSGSIDVSGIGSGSIKLNTPTTTAESTGELDEDTLSSEVEEAIKLLDSKPEEVSVKTEEEQEEEAAQKATGLSLGEEAEEAQPVPAETTEGFSNYGSW